MQAKNQITNNEEKSNIDKKKKLTGFVWGTACVICYIIFEIFYLYVQYSQSSLNSVASSEIAEQIKIRNIFELGIYVSFLIYSWSVWNCNTEKKYKTYFINMAYVIVSMVVLGIVFSGIQLMILGIAYSNHFMPSLMLVWFAGLSLLIISGMQAKKEKHTN